MTENTSWRPFSRDSTQCGKPQTGCVVEFMFLDHGYLATSYPYPLPKEPQEKRIIAKERLPSDMEEFLAKEKHAYIINASANKQGCWIFVYWTTLGEYDEYCGGEIDEYPHIMQLLDDFRRKNRGRVRSTAFGSGEETIFLRASNGQHEWSFRWRNLPFSCEMMIQDSIEQSGWTDRRVAVEGKKLERIQYYGPSTVEEHEGETTSKNSNSHSGRRDDDANKRAAGCIRFLTLGKNDAWIICGETWHIWDKTKRKLPELLTKGLEMGKRWLWVINKVELSLFDSQEFILVYDEGPVFYHIKSPTFEEKFKEVVDQWAATKGVDVHYNDDVVPEKIQSSRNVQRFQVPLGDNESTTSHRDDLESPDTTSPKYDSRPQGLPSSTAVRPIDSSSSSPPQRDISNSPTAASGTRPVLEAGRQEASASSGPSIQTQHKTNSAPDGRKGTQDRRQKGSNGVEEFVRKVLRRRKSDDANT